MKKVLSIVAALMVAVFAMVSCGAVKSASDGIAAGDAYVKAYTAANGDVNALNQAMATAMQAGAAYASDPTQMLSFEAGILQSTEANSADCAGSFLGLLQASATAAGQDVSAGIEQLLSMAKDRAAVEAAMANYTAAPAAEETTEEAPAAEEGAEGEEAPAEESAE